jgi:AraC-like DNA-binding protein
VAINRISVYHKALPVFREVFSMFSEWLSKVSDAELKELLGNLADSPRPGALGWRIVERLPPRGERYPERNRRIRFLRERGLTLGQLSRRFGLSRSLLHKVCKIRVQSA